MSIEVANSAKQVVGTIADLIMIVKKKQLERSNFRQNEECFNYRKITMLKIITALY